MHDRREHQRGRRSSRRAAAALVLSLAALPALAAGVAQPPALLGIPVDFVLFALTLIGVGLAHRHALAVALGGLGAITLYKLAFTGFRAGAGIAGLSAHMAHEWVILVNLLGLLLGFALLARHFEQSRLPSLLPRFLPDSWRGGFLLLALVFVLSSFLDNVAAALIGATMAGTVFRGRLHVGYLAAIVAAANAGGAGSVIGDTTTAMMWIDGVNPLAVLPAFIAAGAALLVVGVCAAIQQQRHSPIARDAPAEARVDRARIWIVALILVIAIGANSLMKSRAPELADELPVLGLMVWAVLLATAGWRRPEWSLLPEAFKGSVFLLALVTCASMMPVETLPAASWQAAFGLGAVSALFDSVALTALALEQGGYDWGVLAFTVGFGGSMIWFGSSAGVAISNMYPQAKSAGLWLRHGWHVPLAYVLGFFVMLAAWGWHPTDKRVGVSQMQSPAVACAAARPLPAPGTRT